jgi:DNA-binding GntR family transcriptional regulator
MYNLSKLEQPGTLQNLAYERIKSLLINGQLEFDEVYSANHFAEILGVSRTPIREALLQLTIEGFFVSLRGRGFKIKEFSEKEIQDFFEARKMIEAYVIEQLVDEVSAEDLKPLDDSFQKALASPGRVQEVIREHQHILEALHQKDRMKAVQAIKYHLDATEKSLLENL